MLQAALVSGRTASKEIPPQEMPKDDVSQQLERDAKTAKHDEIDEQATLFRAGWSCITDPHSGSKYWCNRVSNQTQWDKPSLPSDGMQRKANQGQVDNSVVAPSRVDPSATPVVPTTQGIYAPLVSASPRSPVLQPVRRPDTVIIVERGDSVAENAHRPRRFDENEVLKPGNYC